MKIPFSRQILKIVLVIGLLHLPASIATESADPAIDHAISKVYPALVQIQVIVPYHQMGRELKGMGSGSGVIISPEGHVVTNHHVAGRAKAIRCVLPTKEEIDAILIGTDALSDIAVIKLDLSSRPAHAPKLPVASFGDSDKLKIGDHVLAMGCPLALSQSVTRGIVANMDLMLPKYSGEGFMLDGENVGSLVKWIGHDAQIQPGNSGGPLVNLSGEIVGINEIGLGKMSGAIPCNLAKKVTAELIKSGKVDRSWVGAGFQPLLKSDPSVLSGKPRGVLVSGVIQGSPAENGGLQLGDIILEVDGTPVKAQFQEELPGFNMLMLSKTAGNPLSMKVLRDSKEVSLTLTSELRDHAEGKEEESKEWGLVVEELTTMSAKFLHRPDKNGVLVRSIREGGPSNQANPPIVENDVLVEIKGKPVKNKQDFFEITQEIIKGQKDPVLTLVVFERRNERLLTVVEVGIRTPQDPTQEAQKAWLPVETQVLSRKLATALGLGKRKGVRITQIYPESTAEKDGFQVGDILTQINGETIEASEEQDEEVFASMIRLHRVGSQAEFNVIRDSKPMKITATLAGHPKPPKELKTYEDIRLEFKARDISYFDRIKNRWKKDDVGALVTQVENGGWADTGKLHDGDLIQKFDSHKISNVQDLEKHLKEAHQKNVKHIVFLVRRGISTAFVEIEPIEQSETKTP